MSYRFGNGTGRDSQVQTNDGGFSTRHIPGGVNDRERFQQALRDKHMNRPNFDLLFNQGGSKNQIIKKQRMKKSETARKGLGCVKRLYDEDCIKRASFFEQHKEEALFTPKASMKAKLSMSPSRPILKSSNF